MRRFTVVAALAIVFSAMVVPSSAGPDKIAFPADLKGYVLYTTVDRHDVKQYRELFASSAEAVKAMKDAKPLPHGTVLVLVQYKAQAGAQGSPVRDANGRFVKGDLIGYTVMEKRAGWGAEYPDDLRNGEWEYSAFAPDGKFNDKANYKACFSCHKPHAAQDFVISWAKVRAVAPAAATGYADVTIRGFSFGPKLTAAAGKPVTWLNDDDSPHQITVTGESPTRSPILTRGQSHQQSFAAPGMYDYACALHPGMKGQVEVK